MRNKERFDKYCEEYNAAHREKNRAYAKAYYQEHKNDEEFKQKNKASNRRWRENNREKWSAYCREYRKVRL